MSEAEMSRGLHKHKHADTRGHTISTFTIAAVLYAKMSWDKFNGHKIAAIPREFNSNIDRLGS